MQKQIMSLIIVKILFWEWQDSKGGIETKRKILVSDPWDKAEGKFLLLFAVGSFRQ